MPNSRLPLPGEKPVGVWKPRTPRAQRHWQTRRLRGASVRLLPVLAVGVVVAAAVLIWRVTSLPVTVVLNGEPLALATHRRTVRGAVRVVGVRLDDTVYLDPPADTPLEAGMTITVADRRPVLVHADGQTRAGSTHYVEPRAIVDEMGIPLDPDDAVYVVRAVRPVGPELAADTELADVPSLPRELEVIRPRRVIVVQDGERVAFRTTARTLGEALARAGYALYEADSISLPLQAPLADIADEDGTVTVEISRSLPVTLRVNGEDRPLRTRQAMVSGLLGEVGLALSGADYTVPAIGTPLSAGMSVEVVRVREEVVIEERPIPFETTYVPDPDLELDQQEVIQDGHDGTLARQVRVRYEDGLAVSRAVEGEWVAEEPSAEVVAYGTRIIIRTLTTPQGGTYQYWRRMHMLATSYSPLTAGDKQPGDPRFGISGTGAEVQRGIVAVDPRVVNLYTNLYVPDYGFGQALDVGGAVKGMRVDLGYADDYLVYWNNWVDVYLLVPVPPPDQIIWRLPE